MGLLLLLLGVALGVGTLSLVHQVSVFGNTCFFVGELTAQTQCLTPGVYYGGLGIAGIFVVLGASMLLRAKK